MYYLLIYLVIYYLVIHLHCSKHMTVDGGNNSNGAVQSKAILKTIIKSRSIHRSAETASPHTGAVEVVQAYRVGNGKALKYGSLNSINRLRKMRKRKFTPHLTVFSGSIAWNSNLQYGFQLPKLLNLLSF